MSRISPSFELQTDAAMQTYRRSTLISVAQIRSFKVRLKWRVGIFWIGGFFSARARVFTHSQTTPFQKAIEAVQFTNKVLDMDERLVAEAPPNDADGGNDNDHQSKRAKIKGLFRTVRF